MALNFNSEWLKNLFLKNQQADIQPQNYIALNEQPQPLQIQQNIPAAPLNAQINSQPIAPINTQIGSQPQKGFWGNFYEGAKENSENAWNPAGENNKNESFARKLGEGFGTFGRVMEGPGGDIITAVLNGQQAGLQRQQNRIASPIYRQQLNSMGINNIGNGYISGDTFENVVSANRQRVTYGDLALFDEGIAEAIAENPSLAYQYLPATLGKSIYENKKGYNEAKIGNINAKTETENVMRNPKVEEINAKTGNLNARTETENATRSSKVNYMKARTQQIKSSIAQKDRQLSLYAKKIQQGYATQSDKAEYNRLRNQKIQLEIEQKKLENSIYEDIQNNKNSSKGKKSRNSGGGKHF